MVKMIAALACLVLPIVLQGQQDILGSRTIHGDFTVNGSVTFPVSRGTTLPATCAVGQLFFRTQTQIGIHECRVTNTWTYLGSGGGGISSLGGLTGATQTFATVNDTNITVAVGSTGATHTFTVGFTGTLAKGRQHAATVYNDQNNTFGAFRQSFTSSASEAGMRLVPYAGDPTTLLDGDTWYNSSTNKFRCRVNGVTVDCDTGGGGGVSITRTAVTHSATPTYTRSSAVQQWTQTLTSNVTSSTLSGASAGDLLSFELTQDGTGSRTWAPPTGFPALTLCGTAGSRTTVQYFWTGSAAIRRSYDVSGCSERVIGWEDGTTTTFPAGSDTVATLGGAQTFSGNKSFTGRLNLPNSTTRPATCTVGDVYVDTDATSGQRVYVCEVTDTWVVQGGGGGGGGGASLTAGYCYLSTNCAPPTASLAAITPGAVASRVYVIQIIPPFTMTVAQVAARAGGGGGAGDGFVIGAFANSSNAPGSLIAGCAFVDVTTGGTWKTCATSIALTAGTPVWLAVAVENTAMSVRGYTGAFSSAFTEFNAQLTPSRIGRCANTATGTGTGLTLPATCGSLTSESWAVPMIVATP